MPYPAGGFLLPDAVHDPGCPALPGGPFCNQDAPGGLPGPLSLIHISLDAVRPDVCVIATESGLHAEIARACIAQGRHVLVEKPVALSTADAEAMVRDAEAKGVTLGVCHQNRFNPPVQELRRALDAGRFGRLVNGRCV